MLDLNTALRAAILDHDIACTVHRIEFTQDESELDDLSTGQLATLLSRLTPGSTEHQVVAQHLTWRNQ
jgi:hypothetical protein